MRNKVKIAVLAQEDNLFLPHLVAKLGRERLIQCILVYSPPFSYKRFKRTISRLIASLGLRICFFIGISWMISSVINLFFRYKFYSLRKVAKVYNIPIKKISNLYSGKLHDVIAANNVNIVFCSGRS